MKRFENVFQPNSLFLVTGGAGFIGSNLVEAILGLGLKVRVLDDFSNGKRENVQPYLQNPNFELIEGDITNLDTCMKACKDVNFVLHQAAWGSVPRSIEMPLFYEEVNVRGTLNMLEAAKLNGVLRFVYASSSSVYGDHPVLPKVEGVVGNLLSPYAASKMTDELYAKVYYKCYGLKTYGLRYFNVFGRRQDANGQYAAVIPKFVHAMLTNDQAKISGDGLQSRDFTYIDNVIQANLLCCIAGEGAEGEAYNIACGGRETILDVYNYISDLLGVSKEPIFTVDRAGDIKHSNASIDKAKTLLGYDPKYSFSDGLKLAIDWYKNEFGE